MNNEDMLTLRALSPIFEHANPDIKLRWIVQEENVLRQRQTIDVATRSGIFDVVTTSSFEVPIWSRLGLIRPIRPPASYAINDLLPPIRAAVSRGGHLYAGPFYGESSMIYYRKDLFHRAGLSMPQQPSWPFIYKAAARLHDPGNGIYGLCLRGKAGWGENTAVLTAMANAYGARLFDMRWQPQFTSPAWISTLTDYVAAVRTTGPPGASSDGFNEMLALFASGKCAIWFDATVAAASLSDPRTSAVAGTVGFAFAPDHGYSKKSNWLFVWALGVPSGARHPQEAERFVEWATGPEYQELLARDRGWEHVPPGTRTSFYANRAVAAQPYSPIVLRSINSADPSRPSVLPVPYQGVQYAAIPEYQALGTQAGQAFSAAAAGVTSPLDAAKTAQAGAERLMAGRRR
ncbi:ABC transporter substrate-binding protein [uncultured Sphingomonas sp.]|uniref:ABC transporter substrate-binding protein n=2 Tax=Sphingomonas TaxID=13687 RepID=UPI0035CC1030